MDRYHKCANCSHDQMYHQSGTGACSVLVSSTNATSYDGEPEYENEKPTKPKTVKTILKKYCHCKDFNRDA
jgi:hypothetical protein